MSAKTFILSVIGLLMTIVLVALIASRPKPEIVATNLEHLPHELGGYQGIEDSFPESVNRELNADARLYRHYRSGDGSRIDLYIGYYGTAKGGRSSHNPYACLPGAGWAIVDTGKVDVIAPSRSTPVQINYVQARRDGINTIMFHWYQSAGGKVMSTGIRQNIEKFWDRLLRNRNDGAFVQISSQVPDEQMVAAKGRAHDFAGIVLQHLPRYWPEEK